MLRTLLHIDLDTLAISGFDIQILIDCIVIKNGSEPFINPNTAILLVKSGGLQIRLRDDCFELCASDLVVLTKGLTVAILDTDPKLKLLYVTFSIDYVIKNCSGKALTDAAYFSSGQNIAMMKLDSKSFHLVSIIYKLMLHVNTNNETESQDMELGRVSFNLFLYKLRSIYGDIVSNYQLNFRRDDNLVYQFLSLSGLHLKQQHSVRYYADALHVPSYRLNRVVKHITGKTAKKILEETLVMEAKKALIGTQETIASISFELGFRSSSNFSAFFQKHVGTTALEYRGLKR